MDRSEQVAMKHLLFRGFSTVVYEPDGNVPPDFLVDGSIAVEVRRLGQVVQRPTHEDLDQSSVPLTEGLEGLLASYGAADVTRFIDARFRRPLPKWARVKKGARRFLDEAQAGLLTEGASRAIAPNVELEYVCLAPGDGRAFELNDVDDPDWGGWLLDEFERNLRICVAEKLAKIEPHRSRYPEWWLILVAQPVYGLSQRNTDLFGKTVHVAHNLDRVVVVDRGDHTCYFQL